MNVIKLPPTLAKQACESSPLIKQMCQAQGLFTGSLKSMEIDLADLKFPDIDILFKLVAEKETPYAQSIRFAHSAMVNEVDVGEAINRMSDIYPMLRAYVKKSKRQWVYKQGANNAVSAYVITDVDRSAPRSSYRSQESESIYVKYAYSLIWSPEPLIENFSIGVHTLESIFQKHGVPFTRVWSKHTKKDDRYVIDVVAKNSGQVVDKDDTDDENFEVEYDENASITIKDVLSYFGFYIETKELTKLYQSQYERMERLFTRFGEQLEVKGRSDNGYNMLNEGMPAKCILDTIPHFINVLDEDADEEDDDDRPRSRGLRASSARKRISSDNDEVKIPYDEIRIRLKTADLKDGYTMARSPFLQKEENLDSEPFVRAPLHFLLRIFHLENYTDHYVHVRNLKPYIYKEGLENQLIVNEDVKTMTSMLVASVTDEEGGEDIIEGKSQATIITCIGAPGLGKTLLAEVLAESSKKPLYKVPADQLGMNSDSLENNLHRILRRAERWSCVLMIDEANAYVHSRGHDIMQNALVGVFLRRLEYFKGVLVLTTNQTTESGKDDIDEAILSRSNLVVYFETPDLEKAVRIWKTQAQVQQVESDLDWKTVAREFPSISGRAIRQILRLSKNYSRHTKQPLTIDILKTCSKFIHTGFNS